MMRGIWREILFSFFMGFIVPALLLSFAVLLLEKDAETADPEPVLATTAPIAEKCWICVRHDNENKQQMGLEDYLIGVVLAEMPGSFDQEALKAQAVVARTYTVKAVSSGGKHADGSICTTASCCQAYISQQDYIGRGGTTEVVDKIRIAVRATASQVLTYQGELIEATYFSCSGGKTEDAVAVWGTDYPYLRSVESPGEESAPPYTDTMIFTPEEFQNKLDITLPADPMTWFGSVTYTSGGGVADMEIGDRIYTGTELRAMLGLRSTAFSVAAEEGAIRITTKGYGHRVGMSQYGAEAMAVSGSSYAQILLWYYPGTEITVWF